MVKCIALEFPGAHPQKCYPVAVPGIEIGVYLEDEAGEFLARGLYLALSGVSRDGARRDTNEAVQEFRHTEGFERAPEIGRSEFTRAVYVELEASTNTI